MKTITTTALAIALLAGGLATTSCKSLFDTSKNTSAKTTAQVSEKSDVTPAVTRELTGDWAIIEVDGRQVTGTDTDYPHMGFASNQENPGWIDFYAYNGCNFINGVVAVKGAKIAKQGDFAATMKMCPDAAFEMAISSALEQMQTLRIQKLNNESFLYLINGAGKTVMTLRKHNLNFLEGAWKVTAVDGEKLPADVDIKAVIDLQSNTIFANAGCNNLNGTVEVNMAVENGIGFTNLRTTRMTCPNIAYETRFILALEKVAKATGTASEAELRDAQGNVIIKMITQSKDDLASAR